MRELADPARLPALPSGDYLIRPRRHAATADYGRLQFDAARLLERLVERGDSS